MQYRIYVVKIWTPFSNFSSLFIHFSGRVGQILLLAISDIYRSATLYSNSANSKFLIRKWRSQYQIKGEIHV